MELRQRHTNAECPVSGTNVVINDERFSSATRWNTYQSVVGYSGDGTTLVLGESNYQAHTMKATHDIMSSRLASYGKSLGNAFRFDGAAKAGFYYYKSAYSSTPGVYTPNVIRIQKTNSTCYSLTTVISPTLTAGSVEVTPSNCAQGLYQPNTIVTLTASAKPPYTFSNWSGDASGSTITTTVTMTANKTVTAKFSAPCYSLTTAVNPTGSGSVDSSPAPELWHRLRQRLYKWHCRQADSHPEHGTQLRELERRSHRHCEPDDHHDDQVLDGYCQLQPLLCRDEGR